MGHNTYYCMLKRFFSYFPALLLFLLPFVLSAQIKNDTHDPRKLYKLLRKERKALIRSGVREAMIFEQGVIGPLDDGQKPCNCHSGYVNAYLLWNKNNKHFVKKFDCCNSYREVETADDLFAFYRTHQNSIDTEEVQSQVYVIYYRFRHIHVCWHGKKLDFQLHDYDFTPANRPLDKLNNKLKVKKWCDTLSRAIAALEARGFVPASPLDL